MASNSYEKPDFWSQKAFSEGYPARSVYKLKEIDEKFHILKKNSTVLDLGAAPGSWTIFLLRNLSPESKVVSCDLNPLAKDVKGDNLVFIQGDLTDKTVDTARSQGLVKMAIYYAQTMLRPGGNFAVKVFQNGDQQSLLKMMREVFTSAKGFKPVACRAESFETYLIGINKKNV